MAGQLVVWKTMLPIHKGRMVEDLKSHLIWLSQFEHDWCASELLSSAVNSKVQNDKAKQG